MNIDIAKIIKAIEGGKIRISDHADEEAKNDAISYEEIFFSVIGGEIIEQYPKDKPYPSCLIYGMTFRGEPIHSVWAYNGKTQWAVLVTVYRPSSDKWANWRERRKR